MAESIAIEVAKPAERRQILIVDDSITVRKGIVETLTDSGLFEVFFEARDGAEGLALLHEYAMDLVLCDVVMPGIDGFEFLARARSEAAFAELPVLMLIGQETVEQKIRGLELGASDYLTKPFDEGELIARIKVQLKLKDLQDQLRAANRAMQVLLVTDPLTGVHNRRYLTESLGKEVRRAQRYHTPLSVILADIDHFKRVNDMFGHLQGDTVLVEFGRLLQKDLRVHDVAARFGGEEFVILLPGTELAGAKVVAERVRSAVEAHEFSGMNGERVTSSFGVAEVQLDAEESPAQLLSAADAALYRAKGAGRNRVAVRDASDSGR